MSVEPSQLIVWQTALPEPVRAKAPHSGLDLVVMNCTLRSTWPRDAPTQSSLVHRATCSAGAPAASVEWKRITACFAPRVVAPSAAERAAVATSLMEGQQPSSPEGRPTLVTVDHRYEIPLGGTTRRVGCEGSTRPCDPVDIVSEVDPRDGFRTERETNISLIGSMPAPVDHGLFFPREPSSGSATVTLYGEHAAPIEPFASVIERAKERVGERRGAQIWEDAVLAARVELLLPLDAGRTSDDVEVQVAVQIVQIDTLLRTGDLPRALALGATVRERRAALRDDSRLSNVSEAVVKLLERLERGDARLTDPCVR